MTKPKDNSKLERDQSKEEMWASLWELAAHRTQSGDAPWDGTTHPNTNASTGHYPVSATEVTPRWVPLTWQSKTQGIHRKAQGYKLKERRQRRVRRKGKRQNMTEQHPNKQEYTRRTETTQGTEGQNTLTKHSHWETRESVTQKTSWPKRLTHEIKMNDYRN